MSPVASSLGSVLGSSPGGSFLQREHRAARFTSGPARDPWSGSEGVAGSPLGHTRAAQPQSGFRGTPPFEPPQAGGVDGCVPHFGIEECLA